MSSVAPLSTEKLFSLACSRGVFFLSKYCSEQQYFDCARRGSEWNFHSLSLAKQRDVYFPPASHCARSSSKAPVNSRSRQLAQLHCPPSCLSQIHRELHFMNRSKATTTKDSISSLSFPRTARFLKERRKSIFRDPLSAFVADVLLFNSCPNVLLNWANWLCRLGRVKFSSGSAITFTP
jgi:hypothetical protein